jgi:glutathione S-transferase
VTVFSAKLDAARAKAIATQLFSVLDGHLATHAFLEAARPTVADIALNS